MCLVVEVTVDEITCGKRSQSETYLQGLWIDGQWGCPWDGNPAGSRFGMW